MTDVDQEALTTAVAELEAARFTATGGDGRVSATVSGVGTLVEVEIDPLLERHHHDRLGGWLVAAITDARAEAGARSQERLTPVVGDPAELEAKARAAVPWLSPTRTED